MNFRNCFLNKNEIKLPRIIFLVGAAAAGKTSLAKIIKNEFPEYKILSDLDELKKLAELEKRNQTHGRIKSLSSGGFDIIDPKIWDEILILTTKKIFPEKFYIFEFSRGLDQKYFTFFKLQKYEIYKHCFQLIFNTNPKIEVKKTLIIHVNCNFSKRIKRNQKRKKENRHFVAEKVMESVYSKDIFHYVSRGFNYGYFTEAMRIPVYFIDNSKELILPKRERYFRIQLYKALNFYNSIVLSKRNIWR